MPRTGRAVSSTSIYHIILRSVNQQQIFEDEEDYRMFLYLTRIRSEQYGVTVYAYCLMSNHIHILLHSEFHSLSLCVQSFSSQFARWYNQKYQRFGHLFQSRFSSFCIDNINYFLHVLSYIHENPVNAHMCRFAQEYYWSSCRAYYGAKNPLINIDAAIEFVGSKDLLFQYLSCNADSMILDDTMEAPIPMHMLTEDEVLLRFKKISGCSSSADIQKMNRSDRDALIRKLANNNFSQKQISRFCGISQSTITRILRKK